MGSGSYEQSWRAIPTQRPGPETRNTVILGCYTRNSNFRDSSGEIIMFMLDEELKECYSVAKNSYPPVVKESTAPNSPLRWTR